MQSDLQKLKNKIQEARCALNGKSVLNYKNESLLKYTKSNFEYSEDENRRAVTPNSYDNNELIRHIRYLDDQIFQLQEANRNLQKSLNEANQELMNSKLGLSIFTD